jgi:hypothetical protein
MFKVINSIICDDIRVEVTGKLILIGVYNSTLNAQQPARPNSGLTLNLWMEIDTEPSLPLYMESRGLVEDLVQSTDNVAFSFEFELAPSQQSTHQVSFQFPVRLDFTHSLRLEVKSDNGDWQLLRRLKVNSLSPPAAEVLE